MGKDNDRCAWCGWPLGNGLSTCKRGDCSMRPLPSRLYDRERAFAEVTSDTTLEYLNRHWPTRCIGFTGTRTGMTAAQLESVARLVRRLQPTVARHGGCIGADGEFHWIVRREAPGCRIIGHPGPDESMQARNALADCDEVMPPKNHFARNRDIVELSPDGMIGAPFEEPLSPQGGTAYTVRHSWKRERPTFVAWPNGSLLEKAIT